MNNLSFLSTALLAALVALPVSAQSQRAASSPERSAVVRSGASDKAPSARKSALSKQGYNGSEQGVFKKPRAAAKKAAAGKNPDKVKPNANKKPDKVKPNANKKPDKVKPNVNKKPVVKKTVVTKRYVTANNTVVVKRTVTTQTKRPGMKPTVVKKTVVSSRALASK